MLNNGEKDKAGLAFNTHRILTQFRGYSPNDSVSSDVEACFSEGLDIPDQGAIVVDFFVTRNLAKVVEICENRGIDLSRIRVSAPKAILAAQLMGLNEEKKAEFEAACAKLDEGQFITPDVAHNADIEIDEEIAVWFSPRTMAITPKLMEATEEETIEHFCDLFRQKVAQVVTGGRVFANLAYSDEFTPLAIQVNEGKRKLTKLTGISKNIAAKIVQTLLKEGFNPLQNGHYSPADVDEKIDHAKMAQSLHFTRR